MKISPDLKEYADDIVKDLPPSPHARRFREELLEHMADTQEELALGTDSLNQIKTNIMHSIGSKETLTESFNDFHRSRFSRLWPLELLFFMFLSVFIFLFTLGVMGAYGGVIDESLPILRLIIGLLSLFIAYPVNRVFFSIAARRLTLHAQGKKRILLALALIIPPTLLFAQYMMPVLRMTPPTDWIDESFIVMILCLGMIYVTDGIAFNLLPFKKRNPLKGNTRMP